MQNTTSASERLKGSLEGWDLHAERWPGRDVSELVEVCIICVHGKLCFYDPGP